MSDVKSLGVVGQWYEDRKTKKKGKLIRHRVDKVDAYIFEDEKGDMFSITAGTFKNNWRKVKTEDDTADVPDTTVTEDKPVEKTATVKSTKAKSTKAKSTEARGVIELSSNDNASVVDKLYGAINTKLDTLPNVECLTKSDGASIFYVVYKGHNSYRVGIVVLGTAVNLIITKKLDNVIKFYEHFRTYNDCGSITNVYHLTEEEFDSNIDYILSSLDKIEPDKKEESEE